MSRGVYVTGREQLTSECEGCVDDERWASVNHIIANVGHDIDTHAEPLTSSIDDVAGSLSVDCHN